MSSCTCNKESFLAPPALEQLEPDQPKAARTGSKLAVQDPPGLLLHRHNLKKRKDKQACYQLCVAVLYAH